MPVSALRQLEGVERREGGEETHRERSLPGLRVRNNHFRPATSPRQTPARHLLRVLLENQLDRRIGRLSQDVDDPERGGRGRGGDGVFEGWEFVG